MQESLAIKHTKIPEPPRARQLAVWGHGQPEFSPLKSAGRLLAVDWTSSRHIAMNEFSSSLGVRSVRCSQKRQRTEERTLWATSGKCASLVQLWSVPVGVLGMERKGKDRKHPNACPCHSRRFYEGWEWDRRQRIKFSLYSFSCLDSLFSSDSPGYHFSVRFFFLGDLIILSIILYNISNRILRSRVTLGS